MDEYLHQQIREKLQQRDFNSAKVLLTKILSTKENDIESLYYLGQIYEIEKNPYQAIRIYLSIIQYSKNIALSEAFERIIVEKLSILLDKKYVPINSNIGNGSTIIPKSEIQNTTIGNRCVINQSDLYNVEIGDWSTVNARSKIWNTKIGKFTCIGGLTEINLSGHPVEFFSVHPVFYRPNYLPHEIFDNKIDSLLYPETQNCVIGNDVWIGENVLIKSGVVIGDGAIVGAGSYVNQDLPPYSISYGTPAKVQRYRYSEEIIEKLVKISWWNFAPEKIQYITKLIGKNKEYLTNIQLFLEELEKFEKSN